MSFARSTSSSHSKENQKVYHQYTPIRWKAGEYYVSNIADNVIENLELMLKTKPKLDAYVIN